MQNLLVSSMLTCSVDPRSQMMVIGGDGPEETVENPEQQSYSEQNGGDAEMSDRDETMADAEAEISTEETVGPSEIDSAPAAASPTAETTPSHP